MNKLLLAVTLLAVGAGAFQVAQRQAARLQQELQAANESWQSHTQQLALAQSEQAALTERIRELKQTLAQSRPVAVSALWSALQTNRADRLPLELRQRVLAELGFNWRTSPDYIVVSKQTVRDLQIEAVRDGKLTDVAATVLALTPEERGQVAAAFQQAKAVFKDWVLTHIERTEPRDDVVAQYELPNGHGMCESVSNNFVTAVANAVGGERVELILPAAQIWMWSIGLRVYNAKPPAFIVKRVLAGNEQRPKFEITSENGHGFTQKSEMRGNRSFWAFPEIFLTVFPNGWPDVTKSEGFELLPEPQKK